MDGSSNRRLHVEQIEGRRALVVDGVVQSVAVEGNEPPSPYWAAMLPIGSPRSALLLGLGGGTLAHLLSRRYPGIPIVGVDVDAEMVAFAREQFGLALPNLEVVIADAFDWVAGCRRRFAYVAVDLFHGYRFQRDVLSKPFLSEVARIAGPTGDVAVNLFQDRRTARNLARLARVLPVVRVDEVGRNVVVHCRGR